VQRAFRSCSAKEATIIYLLLHGKGAGSGSASLFWALYDCLDNRGHSALGISYTAEEEEEEEEEEEDIEQRRRREPQSECYD
jgi:hypothetical protein